MLHKGEAQSRNEIWILWDGGVCVYIKENILCKRLAEMEQAKKEWNPFGFN